MKLLHLGRAIRLHAPSTQSSRVNGVSAPKNVEREPKPEQCIAWRVSQVGRRRIIILNKAGQCIMKISYDDGDKLVLLSYYSLRLIMYYYLLLFKTRLQFWARMRRLIAGRIS